MAKPRPPAPALPAGPPTYIFHTLTAGALPYPARRGSFALYLQDGDHVTLVQSEERAPRDLSIGAADREPAWKPFSTTVYTGTRTEDPATHAIDLALAAPGQQPLALHCTHQRVKAVAAGAILVHDPRFKGAECGDAGLWSPAKTTALDALVCAPPDETTPATDPLDADRLAFTAPPGDEHASQNDDCSLQGGGLRFAR